MLTSNSEFCTWSNSQRVTLSFRLDEHYTKFSINAGFNTLFNPKDKVMLGFGIILSLMLIVNQCLD